MMTLSELLEFGGFLKIHPTECEILLVDMEESDVIWDGNLKEFRVATRDEIADILDCTVCHVDIDNEGGLYVYLKIR